MNKKKNFILPVALAGFCVEQVSASLDCQDGNTINQVCNPFDTAIVEPQVKVAKAKDKSIRDNDNKSKSLYNRNKNWQQGSNKTSKLQTLIQNKKSNPSATIKPSNRSKQIIKKVKDIKLSDTNDTSKVSKNRVATIKNYKKLLNKIKNIKNSNKLTPQKVLKLKRIEESLKNKPYYIAEKGDTLRTIAKKTKTPLAKLVKLNKFFKSNHIKVGQKIYYESSINKSSTKTTTAKKRIGNRVLKVTATAYTSHVGQTDKTPFLAAWNNRIKPGMKIIAVSQDLIKKYKLTNGVKVKIKGVKGVFTVRDKMNKRFKKRIDIYMGLNKKKALKWGKKEITLVW